MVPVITQDQKPLMPCSEKRARLMIKSSKATPFWNRGVFCIRLNVEPSTRNLQPIVVGIDPGSKKEGYTVKSAHHTYLNIQADAVTWVKDAVEVRRNMRRARRFRNTPCRQNRKNRARGGIPPSTKARWQWKLRMCRWLSKMFPVSGFVVEDIKAKTKGQRRWDVTFSPLEVGKRWFYDELGQTAPVETRRGWETKQLRDTLGLKKSKAKMAEKFSSHCVDSWVLTNEVTGGHTKPDNERMLLVTPLQFHRRQLHRLQPAKGGIRRLYGGTMSHGLKRGSLVRHPKHGVSYVGGLLKDRISLHGLKDGKRLCQNAKPSDCKFLAYNTWRTRFLPGLKAGVSARKPDEKMNTNIFVDDACIVIVARSVEPIYTLMTHDSFRKYMDMRQIDVLDNDTLLSFTSMMSLVNYCVDAGIKIALSFDEISMK